MKKICIDIRMINSSGIGTFIKDVVIAMVKETPDIFYYLLVMSDGLEYIKKSKLNNVKVIIFNSKIFTLREQFEFLVKLPKDIDLYFSPHYIIPWFCNVKIIATIHDVLQLAHPELSGGIIKSWFAYVYIKYACIRARKIVTVSFFSKNEISKYTGTKSAKITVIYNAVNRYWLDAKKTNPINDRPFILSVGNVKKHKNLKILIGAFDKIKDKVNCDLIIVGKKDGFITGEFKSLKNIIYNDRIKFTGYVDDDKLVQYYKQAKIFIFPSLYEGFGLPPLEAILSGCERVLCSNKASIPEICKNYVEYFDAENMDSLIDKILHKKTEFNNVLVKTKIINEYSSKNSQAKLSNLIDNVI